MLEERAGKPTAFPLCADKQNDVSSIVVELDCQWISTRVSRVMENLLLESADKLLRYKGDAVDRRRTTACCSGRAASLAPTGV